MSIKHHSPLNLEQNFGKQSIVSSFWAWLALVFDLICASKNCLQYFVDCSLCCFPVVYASTLKYWSGYWLTFINSVSRSEHACRVSTLYFPLCSCWLPCLVSAIRSVKEHVVTNPLNILIQWYEIWTLYRITNGIQKGYIR